MWYVLSSTSLTVKNSVFSDSEFENLPLISSIFNTFIFVNSVKLVSFTFSSFKNFEVELTISSSTTLSKLLIVSTRFSEIKSYMTVNPSLVLSKPALTEDDIPVSAKFFNPLVWTKLSTGACWSLYVIELFTEYDKFW